MAAPVRSTTGTVQASFDADFVGGGTVVNNAFDAGTDANRLLVVTVTWHGGNAHTITSVSYNGVALTQFGAQTVVSNCRKHSFYLVAPATGSNTLAVDPSTGVGTSPAVISAYCYSGVDQTTPFENYNTATGSDASAPIDSAVTITSGTSDRLVWTSHGAQGNSVASGAATNFTERVDNIYDSGTLDVGEVGGEAAGAASVATTVTWTGAASINFGAHGASLRGVVSGPTIDTQPTAQTAVLNNDTRTSATFTVAATTSGGALSYQWQFEDSVGAGTYTNITNGGIYAGATSASLVITPTTATSITGRRVRCNVSDSNGTATSSAVALTVMTGPLLSASSGVTNASGVLAPTLTSDDALSTNGEVLLITASIGATVVGRVTGRPA